MSKRTSSLAMLGLAAVGAVILARWGDGKPSSSGEEDAGGENWPDVRVRVEVLNAGGRRGMARLATEQLRDRGFDVVYLGNAEAWSGGGSVVLARTGDSLTARKVADVLGVGAVRNEPDSTRLVDVTVVLGAEWGPRREGEEPRSDGPGNDTGQSRDS